MNLEDLVEREYDDPELAPEILPVDARLAFSMSSEALDIALARTAAVAVASADKEVLAGTSYVLVEVVQASSTTVPFVRLTSSDGKKTVSVVSDASVVARREGSVLFPAHRLREIAKLVPSATTHIEVIGGVATVRSGRALWNVKVGSGDVLAPALRTSGVTTAPVEIGSFREALSAVRRAASTSEARNALMQVQLRNATFTACDGGRVHRARADGIPNTWNVSIPVDAVDEILKALRETSNAEFGYDDRHIVFETDKDRVVAQRLIVPFPNEVDTIVMGPAFTNTDVLRVNRLDLADSVKRVRINANPDSAAVILGLVVRRRNDAGEIDWGLSVRTRDQAGNSSQEVLECSWSGPVPPGDLIVNHRALSDLLEVYKVEDVFFRLGENVKSNRSPLFVEDDDRGFTAVIQQMYSAG